MAKRKRADGFNLAFLDVMACGLGAVLMILIIVKFNKTAPEPPDQIKQMQEQLKQTLEENRMLEKQIGALKGSTSTNEALEQLALAELNQKIAQAKAQQQAVLEEVKKINAGKKSQAPPPPAPSASVSMEGTGDENYLLGLKMEGKNIGILVDVSGSMAESTLPKAMLSKFKPDAQRRNLPKWRRTQRVVNWLLARAPKDSRVALVAYNDMAQSVGRPTSSAKVSGAMQRLGTEFAQISPRNGSNLYAGIEKVYDVLPDLTDLYIVTDGLPNLAPSSAGLGGCSAGKNVSGRCRLDIFRHAIRAYPGRGKVNVILLPFEGDVDAPWVYWEFARATGGMVIAPAVNWP